MNLAVPGGVASVAKRRLGGRDLRSASRLVRAWSTTTAIEKETRSCRKDRFRSTVTDTSNCADARASNSPFLSVVHPHLTRGLYLVGSKLAAEAPVDTLVEEHPHETVSISRSFASEETNDLLARHRREPFEKVID
jgi:hypothetical protein